jgi:SPP1 gp7 family putative phage head morphogenesis protein
MVSVAHIKAQRAIVEAATGRRLRRRRVPRAQEPRSQRQQYTAELLTIARQAAGIIKAVLLPELPRIVAEADKRRTDARFDAADMIERVIGDVRFQYGRVFTGEHAKAIANKTANAVNRFNREDVNRQVKAVLGVELGSEPAIAARIPAFVRDNVKLIKSIPEKLLSDVDDIVSRGFRRGDRYEAMAEEITSRFDVTESRAKLIARDQIGSLNGELTKVRQESLGATTYVWRTARDERVRGNPGGKYPDADPSHWDREGQVFSWADPPEDGHPGSAINCRCSSELNTEDLLDDLGL